MSDLKIFTESIEQKAMQQIKTLISQPAFSDCKIRIMPDVHAGAGCVIGFTADLGDKVIPNVVGVDIGCGIDVAEIKERDIDFEKLDAVIQEEIPSGFEVNVEPSEVCEERINELRCKNHLRNMDRLVRSIGSLGGGNHFIEVDQDEEGSVYLVVHTGSRNIGLQVANYYQNLAIDRWYGKRARQEINAEIVARLKAEGREKDISDALKAAKKEIVNIPQQLCYLEGEDRLDYLHDMGICQDLAAFNRSEIIGRILWRMGWRVSSDFSSVHNYISFADNIVRKGAISSRKGEKIIIPLNMRDGCIIGIGKGNDDWNQSAPHGAGRTMSRTVAKNSIDMDEYRNSMQGIFTTSVNESTLDECPMAYKPMDEILNLIKPTVDVVEVIKPVYNFKAGGE